MNGAQPVVTSIWASMASWLTPTVLFCFLNLVIGTIVITSSFKTQTKQQQERCGEHDSPQLVRAPSLMERVRSIDFSLYKFEQHNSSETHYTHPPEEHNQLARAPSFLERVRSMKFPIYSSEQPDAYSPVTQNADRSEVHARLTSPPSPPETQYAEGHNQLTRTPSFLERLRSMKFSLYQSGQTDSFCLEIQHADSIDDGAREVEAETGNRSEDWDHQVTRSKSDTQRETPARNPAKLKKSTSEKMVAGGKQEDNVYSRRPATVRETKGRWSQTTLFGEDEEVDAKADDFINRFKQQLRLQRLDSLLKYKEKLNAAGSAT